MIRELGMVARHQASNLVRLATGVPVAPVPMGSMTLDIDDVRLARESLDQPDQANDSSWPAQFERDFAQFCGADEALTFRAGRVALSAILHALEIGPGDEVIVPGYTCVVVPNAVTFCGATPVYCDIELHTYGADAQSVRAAITSSTRAIVLQHLYGLVSRDYEQILELARERGVAVIEDCAHATGATLRGTSVGLRGDAGFFSSEQSKIINTTCGGIAISRRPEIVKALRQYQIDSPWPAPRETQSALQSVVFNYYRFKHPQRWWRGDIARFRYGKAPYIATQQGEMQGEKPTHYRARMSPAIARIASNQLRKTAHYNARRRANAIHWDAWCDQNGYAKPLIIDQSTPVFLRYPTLVEPHFKSNPKEMAKRHGVLPGVWFSSHLHPSTHRVDGCPNADTAIAQCVNLPTLRDHDEPR